MKLSWPFKWRPKILRAFPQKPTTTIGLDITESHIRVVEILNDRGDYAITQVVRKKTPPGVFVDGVFVGSQLLSNELMQLWKQYRIREHKVAICLRGGALLVRVLVAPPMSVLRQETWLLELASKYVVFSGKTVVVTAQVVADDAGSDGLQNQLLAMFATSDLIANYEKTLKAAGLIARFMVPSVSAILRVYNNSTRGEHQVVVCVEDTQTLLVVLNGNRPTYIHSIALAAALLRKEPSAQATWGQEAMQCITQYARKQPLNKIAVNTEDAQDLAWISQVLGTDVPITPLTPASEGLPEKAVASIGPEDVACLGLALPLKYDANFSKWDTRQQELKKLIVYLATSVAIISSIMLLVFFILYFSGVMVSRQIHQIRLEINNSASQFQQVVKIETNLQTFRTLIEGRRLLIPKNAQFIWPGIFRELPTYMNNRTRMTLFQSKGDSFIVIKGQAHTSEDIFQFLRLLKASPYYESADLQEVVHDTNTQFLLFSIQLKRKDHQDGGP